jgi:hypothetical protein
VGHLWKSLSILRLGIVRIPDSQGLADLKLVLRKLVNLRQLHLTCREDLETQLDSVIDRQEIFWHQLCDLTLPGFVATESTLQCLLKIPTLENISLGHFGLLNDGCWIRTLRKLHNRGLKRVCLSGWLANVTMDQGWLGDNENGRVLFREVKEWLTMNGAFKMEDGCPFTMEKIMVL